MTQLVFSGLVDLLGPREEGKACSKNDKVKREIREKSEEAGSGGEV